MTQLASDFPHDISNMLIIWPAVHSCTFLMDAQQCLLGSFVHGCLLAHRGQMLEFRIDTFLFLSVKET